MAVEVEQGKTRLKRHFKFPMRAAAKEWHDQLAAPVSASDESQPLT